MVCKFDEKLLHLYVDGELGADTKARVVRHLETCDECKRNTAILQLLKQKLSDTAVIQSAPFALKQKILENLDSEQPSKIFKLNFIDSFKLRFTKFYLARIFAVSLTAAAILMFIFIPTGDGLNSIAGVLADEHYRSLNSKQFQSLHSCAPSELSDHFCKNLGSEIAVPDQIGKGIKLKCGNLINLDGKPAAHALYTDGKRICSMFVINPDVLENSSHNILFVSGKKIEFAHARDLNLICWEADSMMYILCSCCPLEKLVDYVSSHI